MRILQLIHKPQNRGAETFACQLSHHLRHMGHDVKIVSVYSGEAKLPFSPQIESLNGSSKKRVVDIQAWRKLSQIIGNFTPDIVQANSGDTLKVAVLSKLFFKWNIPIISRNASEVGRYLNSFFQIKLNKFLYKRVEKVISVSRASEADLIQHFPFLQDKTEVIGVGLEMEKDISPINTFPKDKKNIIHIGGFSFEKNHSGLLRIFQKVLKHNPMLHLHLIGDGPLRNHVAAMAQEMQILEKVTFYGFITNPLSYIKSGDVLVLPSIIEGLPGVLLEAMYCKTPVIAYDVGGISEIVNCRTGIIIPKGNENKFAEELIRTLQYPDDLKIEHSYQMVVKDFLNNNLAHKFVNSYNKVKYF